ncbi:MAG TPA: hypothetical protein VML55_13870 [Planctomycetaceae bacterium]|nr:hypothetical protein [Planctomycetaceae bacterium]
MRKFAVIGLGWPGMELARQLGASPAHVIARKELRPLFRCHMESNDHAYTGPAR